MKTTPALAAAGLLVAAVVALSGCSQLASLIPGSQPVRDSETAEITEGGQLDVFSVAVGDCFDDEGGSEVTDVPVVPCSDPHDNEVYYDFTMDGTDFDADAITAASEEYCAREFDTFVGLAYADSVLDWSTITPTSGSWAQGDRLVSCIVYEYGVKTSGSLKGAQR